MAPGAFYFFRTPSLPLWGRCLNVRSTAEADEVLPQ